MKQTAVDFLATKQAELFLQFTNKKISLSEYAVNITNANKQANKLFQEQHGNTWDEAVRQSANKGGMHAASICYLLNTSNSENHPKKQYFNKTFNQEK